MSSEETLVQSNEHADPIPSVTSEEQLLQLNKRLENDFMSYCYSFLNEDEEAHHCVQAVWKKYLECVGDAAMLAAFFDTLPHHIKASVLPKYQTELLQWCEKFFRFQSDALLYSTSYAETFQRVIRYALKTEQYKKGVIYVATDFDPNFKVDLLSSIANIKFEQITNSRTHEDTIDINQLEEWIKRDLNDSQVYPLMVIANAGSALLGRCDELTKIKKLCEDNNLWLHVIGDLLGSLALLPAENKNIKLSCDSLTIDTMKLFGIQNLPYLTFFLRSQSLDENNSSITAHSLYELILQSPSVNFLSIWSIIQRCSNDTLLDHMKKSFDGTKILIQRLNKVPTFVLLNEDNNRELNTYQRIASDNALSDLLPKPVVIFRFQSDQTSTEDINAYIDLLNLWLFDKLSQQYPKMNLELLKSVNFQAFVSEENSAPVHALRFAPLEHLLDIVEPADMDALCDDLERYNEIIVATMTARLELAATVAKLDNLQAVAIPNWAGIGAVRYIPRTVNPAEINETAAYEINTVQVELARQLQTNDSAFSLGGGTEESDSLFYLRLGMIRKKEDLNILLQKISEAGKETEMSIKYVEDMAEKIKTGIEQAQKDLHDENLNVLAQDGLLRQLPLISNVLSWWSPPPSSSPLAYKGRSFDLNSGRVESTEDTYTYRMQIRKQSSHAPTHNPPDAPDDKGNATA